MSIEIIGMAGTQEGSESRGTFDGPPVKAGDLTRFAQAHETAGFGPRMSGGLGRCCARPARRSGPVPRCCRHERPGA